MRTVFAFAALLFLAAPAQAAIVPAVQGPDVLVKDVSANYTITLADDHGQAIATDQLKTVHEAKMHLLVIDDSMTDYQHLHPVAGEQGFTFSFTPKTARSYTAWVDITEQSGKHHYLPLSLTGAEPCVTPCVDKTLSDHGADGVLSGKIAFDRTLAANRMVMGVLHIAKTDGTAVGELQPVMGAFAHVVGFYTDRPEVVHLHPVKKMADGGGYDMTLHMDTGAAGVIKLFAQVKVDGQEHFIPLTIDVK